MFLPICNVIDNPRICNKGRHFGYDHINWWSAANRAQFSWFFTLDHRLLLFYPILGYFNLINSMCKFFKQPPDPIGAEEPHLANWTTHNWIVTTSLSANFGIGPRACKRFPFITVGNISSITQKHGRIKSSRFMASLLIRLANQLKIVDFMSLFLCKNYLHIGLANCPERLLPA